jgi:predicted RecB family endonuclease
VGVQSVIETLFAAQKRGYKCIVLHARIKSGASSLGKKLGFSQVKLIEGFLQSEELVSLMACSFPVSNTNHV